MITYLLKRFLAMVPTLLGISLVTFLIVYLAPGDPVATKMGQNGGRSATEGGSSDDPDRAADAAKAKKKLLGMLEDVHAAVAWDGVGAVRSRDWQSTDKYKTVDDLRVQAMLGELDGWVRAVALSPDDATLYVGTQTGAVVGLAMPTGETRTKFDGHERGVYALAVSPDGSLLISSDGEGELRLHDTASGGLRATVPAIGRPVRDLAFMPDGATFLSACDDGNVRVHDTATGRVDRQLGGHTNFVAALAVSPDATRLYTGGYDRVLRTWDTATWRVVNENTTHGQPINDLDISADGTLLASACDDHHIRVFRLVAGVPEPLHDLEGHYAAATAVAIHPDGRTLFSGGMDETVRAWDLDPPRQTAQAPESTGRIQDIVLTSDGGLAITAGETIRETPLLKQYWGWLTRSARGDFGRSFQDNKPVIDKIAERLPITLGLNACAILIIYLVSIPLGVHAAVKRGKPFDTVTSLFVFMLWSLPNFFLATLLIMYLSSQRAWDLLPSVGLHATNQEDLSYLQWLVDWGAHVVLPMIVLTYTGFATLSRYARTSMLETIQQDFVRTARAKGLSERVVVYKHALRNSLIAIITLVGSLLPAMIGGSVIVEYIFSIRGMGLLAFESILSRDYPVVMAVTTFSAVLTLLGVLVSDLLYSVADPRITHK